MPVLIRWFYPSYFLLMLMRPFFVTTSPLPNSAAGCRFQRAAGRRKRGKAAVVSSSREVNRTISQAVKGSDQQPRDLKVRVVGWGGVGFGGGVGWRLVWWWIVKGIFRLPPNQHTKGAGK